MADPRVLVLAGTTEARHLVAALAPTVEVTASLAGRTAKPVDLEVPTRVGGFGGVQGLAGWLREHAPTHVVDATHPFAAVMPWHVAAACEAVGLPRLRLLRPGWTEADGDRWTRIAALADAPRALAALGATRVLLTTGRQELAPFAATEAIAYVVRSIDPPDLPGAEVVLGRGPFTVEDELELLRSRSIDAVVTKDSGGDDAKLVAARTLGLPVVVVDRPPQPQGALVATVEAAVAWVQAG